MTLGLPCPALPLGVKNLSKLALNLAMAEAWF